MSKKDNINNKVKEVTDAFHDNKKGIPSDTLGSYLGTTTDYEEPVQDADDI